MCSTVPSWVAPHVCGHTIVLFSLQFIDGRLDLLNSGKGFSDVFEEEINMGEYAGKRLLVAFLG